MSRSFFRREYILPETIRLSELPQTFIFKCGEALKTSAFQLKVDKTDFFLSLTPPSGRAPQFLTDCKKENQLSQIGASFK